MFDKKHELTMRQMRKYANSLWNFAKFRQKFRRTRNAKDRKL